MDKRGLQALPPFAKGDEAEGGDGARPVYVVIETPKGAGAKYKHDPEREVVLLEKLLPAGAAFPCNFGYVPGTRGGDGDPLDVLLLIDEPAYPGTVCLSRLVGVLETEQVEKGATVPVRNDRLLAVPLKAPTLESVRDVADVDARLLTEIEHFFVSYAEMEGKKVRPLGRKGAAAALRLVKESAAA